MLRTWHPYLLLSLVQGGIGLIMSIGNPREVQTAISSGLIQQCYDIDGFWWKWFLKPLFSQRNPNNILIHTASISASHIIVKSFWTLVSDYLASIRDPYSVSQLRYGGPILLLRPARPSSFYHYLQSLQFFTSLASSNEVGGLWFNVPSQGQ